MADHKKRESVYSFLSGVKTKFSRKLLGTTNQILYLHYGVTLACFIGITIAPTMKSNNLKWYELSSWLAAMYTVPLLIFFALYVKFGESLVSKTIRSESKKIEWNSKHLHASTMIHKLVRPDNISNAFIERSSITECRQSAIHSARLGIRKLINAPANELVEIAIVDYCGECFSLTNKSRMCISRNTQGIDYTGKEFKTVDLISHKCIKEAKRVIVNNISKHEKWDAIGNQSYESAMAVPITRNDASGSKRIGFGSIFIYSVKKHAFYGREMDIEILLQPYLAAISLTYP